MFGLKATSKERHAPQFNIIVSCLLWHKLCVFHISNHNLHITRWFTGQAFATANVSSLDRCGTSNTTDLSKVRKVEWELECGPSHIYNHGW